MIEVTQIRLKVNHSEHDLGQALMKRLNISSSKDIKWKIFKCSIDARKKGISGVRLIYTIHVESDQNEESIQLKKKNKTIKLVHKKKFNDPINRKTKDANRPIIIGSGPCGYFAALYLARAGKKPIVIERGKEAGPRARDVTRFWREGGKVDPESNVQFGEGGAGTFSDGKLYTGIKDKDGAVRMVLEELAHHGAPKNILTKGKPHIGTDKLITVLRSIRNEIKNLGGIIKFGTRVDNIIKKSGRVIGVVTSNHEEILSDNVILAVGHSARDTFSMLLKNGVAMESKPFSIGARIEHPQTMIDKSLYGDAAGHEKLGSAPYKFVRHQNKKNSRSCYSFCMCPGGLVVAATSEPGHTVTNGMSSYARADANANSGFMVEIFPNDFDNPEDPLSGIKFQRKWERKAFLIGGPEGHAPAQLLGDFMQNKTSTSLGEVSPSYRPGVVLTDLRECLPNYVIETMKKAVSRVSNQIPGFDRKDAILTAAETRSSSPLRINRKSSYQSPSLKGLYPAGEGAGYAGGILSAAVDGLRVAQAVNLNIESSQ